jgi:hypothetical protein
MDVEIVLNDQDGTAGFDQSLKRGEQFVDVVEVKTRRRLVKDKEFSGSRPGHEGCQLDALRLSAGQRRRGLTEPAVAQANFFEHLEFFVTLGTLEKKLRLANRHLKYFVDVLPLNRISARRFCIECPAFFADQLDIGKNRISTVTVPRLADSAAAARNVE